MEKAMTEEAMAKVKVNRDCNIQVGTGEASVHYPAGFEGTAKQSHIDQIVAAGAGERVGDAPQQAQGTAGQAQQAGQGAPQGAAQNAPAQPGANLPPRTASVGAPVLQPGVQGQNR